MGIVKGDLRVLQIRVDDTWMPVCCLTVNGLRESTEPLPVTTRDDFGFSTSIPLRYSYNLDFSFEHQEESQPSKIGIKKLRELKCDRKIFAWRLEDVSNLDALVGMGYLSDLSEDASVGQAISFTAGITGFGKWYAEDDIEPPSVPFLMLDIQISPTLMFTTDWTLSTDNIGIDCYELQKYNNLTSEWETIFTGNLNSFQDLSVMFLTFYAYRVRAKDLAGNVSDWSNTVKGSAPLPLEVPMPCYKQNQDSTQKLHQNGVPKVYQNAV